jgi:transposase
VLWVDDRRVISGIIRFMRGGLMCRGAPAACGRHKTLCNRFVRWGRIGAFDRIFAALAAEGTATETAMIDPGPLKAHRTAASLVKKSCSPPYRADQGRPELQAARRL